MATAHTELWRERLTTPAYRIMEAARSESMPGAGYSFRFRSPTK
jgi:hypothetical protein